MKHKRTHIKKCFPAHCARPSNYAQIKARPHNSFAQVFFSDRLPQIGYLMDTHSAKMLFTAVKVGTVFLKRFICFVASFGLSKETLAVETVAIIPTCSFRRIQKNFFCTKSL